MPDQEREYIPSVDCCEDARAEGYRRGYDIATARAESRRRLGLPIERTDHEE